MLDPRHLLRMKRLAQNPPSITKVWIVLGAVALCLILFAVERWIGWPEALSAARSRPVIVR